MLLIILNKQIKLDKLITGKAGEGKARASG